MEVKLFQKTQRDLAASINQIIDQYWENKLDEYKMVEIIEALFNNNERKFMKDGRYTKVLQQQCGKRRLDIVDRILQSKESYTSISKV